MMPMSEAANGLDNCGSQEMLQLVARLCSWVCAQSRMKGQAAGGHHLPSPAQPGWLPTPGRVVQTPLLTPHFCRHS